MVQSDKLILVVDDEVDICELMSDRLDMEGFRTVTACSGNEAVKILSQHPDVNLIITDVRMPDGDGIYVLEQAKKINPKIPVVIVTGFSDFSEDDLRKNGAKSVISKPINYEELLKIINESLPN